MRLRTELRTHLRATVALIVLVGLGGGVVLATAAGARRTDTAFPRFRRASRAADVLISPQATGLKGFYARIERLPEVERAAAAAGVFLFALGPSGPDPNLINAIAAVDGRFGHSIYRPKVIEGRLPRPDQPLEAMVNRFAAQRLHLHPGSTLRMISFRERPPNDPSKVRPSDYTVLTMTITGVGVLPDDVVPVAQLDAQPSLLATPAYFRKYADPNALGFDGLFVQLRSGASVSRFHKEVDRIALRHKQEIGGNYFFADEADHTARVQRAIRPQSIALAFFALLAAATALLAIGQILARQLFLDAGEYPILRGLGMTRSDLAVLAIVRVAVIALAGALVAVIVAFLASPMFPIGPARLAEPNPGISANVAFLGLGFLGIVISLVAVAAYPAWRGASALSGVLGAAEVRGSERPSRVANAAARTAAPPAMSAGLRMALEPGRGRTAVPVRTALIGLIAAIAAVASAFTYSTNLNRLVSTPRLYGWNWDTFVDAGFGPIGPPSLIRSIASDPSIADLAAGTYGADDTIVIRGKRIPAVGIQPFKGQIFPTIVEGRPPLASDEVVLGASTLRATGTKVGDGVTATVNEESVPMRIVGRAVFPSMGRGSFTPTGLGEGAMLTGDAFAPPFLPPDQAYNFLLIRLGRGVDRAGFDRQLQARLAANNQACGAQAGACFSRPVERPADIANYARVRATPLMLAGLLALIATAMIGHALATSVRRRRHDLAILKTLGFVRRQVSATVAWQATTLAVVALALGLPIGVAVGRWIWAVFADQLGVPPEPVVNLPIVLLAIPATLSLANLIAAIPGRLASRTQPAAILRTE